MKLPISKSILRLYTTASTIRKLKRVNHNHPSVNSIKPLHAFLIRNQLHRNPHSISPVLKAYALSPTHLHSAHIVFTQIQQPILLNFNCIIWGLSISDNPSKAFDFYRNCMFSKGIVGDNMSFVFLLKSFTRVNDVLRGGVFHGVVLKLGFCSDLFVLNCLIHMYSCFGYVVLARKVFDEMAERDLVSWNSLICGYGQCKMFEEVLGAFYLMRERNVIADSLTMVKVIMACGHLGKWDLADSMVEYIERNGVEIDVYLGNTLIDLYGQRGSVELARAVFDRMPERNIVTWNAMIMGYTKAGDLSIARELFDKMPRRDVVSWTTLIKGYARAHGFSNAINLFYEMVKANIKPDEITVATVLSASARIGSLDSGKIVHEYIFKYGVKVDVYVGNALIDMYSKCGDVEKALEVFRDMEKRDSISWTAVISGLAVNGFANQVIELFEQMLHEGFPPTHGSFVGLLVACSHAGFVNKGLHYFDRMEKLYGLKPEMKHYGCIVDLLGRSGDLNRAYVLINTMPFVPDVTIWRIFLSACKLHGDLSLAEIARNKLLELDPSNSGNYVLLSSAYAGSGRWDDATKLRDIMEEGDAYKPSGHSSIEVNEELS